jgi:NADH-quinone oxidoreductase subunit L
MTAFYMFRLFFMTFVGDDRDHEAFHHAHESPALITVPMIVLAFFSAFAGWGLSRHGFLSRVLPEPAPVAAPMVPAAADAALPPAPPAAAARTVPAAPPAAAPAERAVDGEPELPAWTFWTVLSLILASVSFAYFLYGRGDFAAAEGLRDAFAPLVVALDRRWFFDDLFLALVALSDRVAALAFWIDGAVIDRVFVDGWGLLTRIFSEVSGFFDATVVDTTVDGFAGLGEELGLGLRALVRDGQVQEYMLYAAVAFSLAATLILTR